ncbi:hypothetical protein ASC77_23490 [Nocardioides sp. Root1257]|uniref:hypothetical protein n=1 Tax=unclassified Nocardioides TaxID=2615069 RepID=UPI0006F6193E|nr:MULTISPECIES: hypothetical protein [unclassified Nocardioides]KQW42631.1 hypothetical protein ASC77_23490 [Nocardioides sp. Root1257]KRC39889.1 hypothetical protein ASE24_23285 [Nocardioides sp. Root224]
MAGYDAGRRLALQAGSSAAGYRWLADHPEVNNALIAGYEWALWDYEDANGLVHSPASNRAAG